MYKRPYLGAIGLGAVVTVSVGVIIGYFLNEKRERNKNEKLRTKTWNHKLPCDYCENLITGIRYRCANCISYNLCGSCEKSSGDIHDKKHIFVKIRLPLPLMHQPSMKPLLPVLYTGSPDLEDKLELNDNEVLALRTETQYTQEEIEDLFEQFRVLQRSSGIDKENFVKCLGPLGIHQNIVADRLFYFFDRGSLGVIDFAEFVCGIHVLSKGSLEDKIKYSFQGYDLDNDGFITKQDLFSFFKAYFLLSKNMVKNAIKAIQKQSTDEQKRKETKESPEVAAELGSFMLLTYQDSLQQLIERGFEKVDTDNDGRISLEQFSQWAREDKVVVWLDLIGPVF